MWCLIIRLWRRSGIVYIVRRRARCNERERLTKIITKIHTMLEQYNNSSNNNNNIIFFRFYYIADNILYWIIIIIMCDFFVRLSVYGQRFGVWNRGERSPLPTARPRAHLLRSIARSASRRHNIYYNIIICVCSHTCAEPIYTISVCVPSRR